MKVAFATPIKPPDHPIPSGDRAIARNILAALATAGIEAKLATRFIAYAKRPSTVRLEDRRAEALAEAARVTERLRPNPPDAWLTYHPYSKAPDWIGPAVASALSIPYATVEAARTGQPGWSDWTAESARLIATADRHFVIKPTDRAMLEEIGIDPSSMIDLPPFVDLATLDAEPGTIEFPSHWRPDVPVVLVAAMMRPGKKLLNFQLAGRALSTSLAVPFNLVVAGGGPAETAVHEAFRAFKPDRIHFPGVLRQGEVLAAMSKADLFVWPGHREPIGMMYLEAASRALPVAAFADMGVPLVVEHGRTGLLAPRDDMDMLCRHIATLLAHADLRHDLGQQARRKVETRHGLDAAGETLRAGLRGMIE